MKRTEIPAVKCYTFLDRGYPVLALATEDRRLASDVPFILRTAAADKLILDVVREAVFLVRARNGRATEHLDDLVQRLEKAGVKL